MKSKKSNQYTHKKYYLNNFFSTYNYDEKFSLVLNLNIIPFNKKNITLNNEGIFYSDHFKKIFLEWSEIESFKIIQGLVIDTLIINNLYIIKTITSNRNLLHFLKEIYPTLQRYQQLNNLNNIGFNQIKTHPLNIKTYDLYPEVVAATLSNLFHFAALDNKNLCDLKLYSSILYIFLKFPMYQKKLIQRKLHSSLTIPNEAIFEQINNINHLLSIEVRYSILENYIIITNQTKAKNNQKTIETLKEKLKI
ncbi:hypothetical protein ABIC56_000538 [Acinetobacter bereziniae]|uniref:hypothetical protein n=1 Tax=Acinetobacter bereziniae TaxID=106648 RepID=UPI00285A0C11|nr:hypothetical protein [Acinetobacter bereziniae]MDR6539995.1 hypothetical protein [Acinetobacter bereziniae]